MRDKLKIGFIGTGDWGAFYLQLLNIHSNISIASVLTLNYQPNKVLDNSDSVDRIFYSSLLDYKYFTKDLDMIIMAGWPYKISQEIIEYYSLPILNIHGSLLPKYRGPEPIIQQILHGEKAGGVTIYKIDAEWDNGEICKQFSFSIEATDDNKTLFLKTCRTGKKCLENVIQDFLNGRISFTKQSNIDASYYPKIDPTKFIIDSTKSMGDVQRSMRAFVGAYPLLVSNNDRISILKRFLLSKEKLNKENEVVLKDGYIYFLEAEQLEQDKLYFSNEK